MTHANWAELTIVTIGAISHASIARRSLKKHRKILTSTINAVTGLQSGGPGTGTAKPRLVPRAPGDDNTGTA